MNETIITNFRESPPLELSAATPVLKTGIDILASRNYIRANQNQAEREGTGRKASATYETNPETF